jgi:hypothetical protein
VHTTHMASGWAERPGAPAIARVNCSTKVVHLEPGSLVDTPGCLSRVQQRQHGLSVHHLVCTQSSLPCVVVPVAGRVRAGR